MPPAASSSRGFLPRWLVVVGSAAILFHFTAVVMAVLASPSGPWAMPGGAPTMYLPPQFASRLREPVIYVHARALKMGHSYHFLSNRSAPGAVFLEVRLRKSAGSEEMTLLRFPDRKANPWVRHRQLILARALLDDVAVEQQQGDRIPPPGQPPRMLQFWAPSTIRGLKLEEKPEHLVPREQNIQRPSDLAVVLFRSYGRFLCRKYGAVSAEIIRHSRDPIPPDVLLNRDQTPVLPEELIANFGEVKVP
jgi:hypothetical protein